MELGHKIELLASAANFSQMLNETSQYIEKSSIFAVIHRDHRSASKPKKTRFFQLPKLNVGGSIPPARSIKSLTWPDTLPEIQKISFWGPTGVPTGEQGFALNWASGGMDVRELSTGS